MVQPMLAMETLSLEPNLEQFFQGPIPILRSQFWDVPAVVRHFNLTFDKWMSFDDSDYAAVEVSHDSGQSWFTLDTWNGSDEVWKTEHYNLDSLSLQSTIGFRFIINTSLSTGIDEGLFIDSFNLSETKGTAWRLAAW